jgi:hypothetical protein
MNLLRRDLEPHEGWHRWVLGQHLI